MLFLLLSVSLALQPEPKVNVPERFGDMPEAAEILTWVAYGESTVGRTPGPFVPVSWLRRCPSDREVRTRLEVRCPDGVVRIYHFEWHHGKIIWIQKAGPDDARIVYPATLEEIFRPRK